jgi:DNA-directed RNA polymerase specialized sigma24 family protein
MTDRERLLDKLRPVPFTTACWMPSSISNAEHMVQEARLRLRLHQALQADEQIASPRAFAATVTTRLAINELRSAPAASATPASGCQSRSSPTAAMMRTTCASRRRRRQGSGARGVAARPCRARWSTGSAWPPAFRAGHCAPSRSTAAREHSISTDNS